jgi:anti-sigma B factor antagonist
MKIQILGDTLRISDVEELDLGSLNSFQNETRAALINGHKNIEIDLSQTRALDSCGLGTLISLHKLTSDRHGMVRLLNPAPAVRQILELTRMHRIFQIVQNCQSMTGPVTTVHQPNVLQVTLHCDVADVRPAVQMAHDFLAKQGWQESDLMSFDLALVEACNNAIKYAGESGRQRPVVLETICQPALVEFRVHDHTPGFAWPKKIALPEPESESGRGLYLINSLTDYAGYFRGQDGNVLVMRKNGPQSTGNSVAAKISGSGRLSGTKTNASSTISWRNSVLVTRVCPPSFLTALGTAGNQTLLGDAPVI